MSHCRDENTLCWWNMRDQKGDLWFSVGNKTVNDPIPSATDKPCSLNIRFSPKIVFPPNVLIFYINRIATFCKNFPYNKTIQNIFHVLFGKSEIWLVLFNQKTYEAKNISTINNYMWPDKDEIPVKILYL